MSSKFCASAGRGIAKAASKARGVNFTVIAFDCSSGGVLPSHLFERKMRECVRFGLLNVVMQPIF